MKAAIVMCALLMGVSYAHAETKAHKKTTHTQEQVKKDGKNVIKNKKTVKETTTDDKMTNEDQMKTKPLKKTKASSL